jgi:hypothetical protein
MSGNFKVKESKNPSNKKKNKNIQVMIGSIVEKRLKVYVSSTSEFNSKKIMKKANVFGSVKEKVKNGRWRVEFDNKMNLNLKKNEFNVVVYNPKQQVIVRDNMNFMVMKSSGKRLMSDIHDDENETEISDEAVDNDTNVVQL